MSSKPSVAVRMLCSLSFALTIGSANASQVLDGPAAAQVDKAPTAKSTRILGGCRVIIDEDSRTTTIRTADGKFTRYILDGSGHPEGIDFGTGVFRPIFESDKSRRIIGVIGPNGSSEFLKQGPMRTERPTRPARSDQLGRVCLGEDLNKKLGVPKYVAGDPEYDEWMYWTVEENWQVEWDNDNISDLLWWWSIQPPLPRCSDAVQGCKDRCNDVTDVNMLICSANVTLATSVGGPGLGTAVGLACGGAALVARQICRDRCEVPRVPCTY